MKDDLKKIVEDMSMDPWEMIHIHWDNDVDDHRFHCMAMQNNRDARKKYSWRIRLWGILFLTI